MNKDIAIKVDNLSKVYKLYNAPIDRMKEALHPFKKSYHKEFYALNDVSFEIKKGETVGIIGKNGSGKSTLLKIITGVLNPTHGKITVNGRISALLELGAGFNPEYTGLENIYFQGNLMGYSRKEMDTKIDSIIQFADIGDFIYQPVKNYSSGMFARLAFAVSINIEPDILIVDEALSVGDMNFQAKCMTAMERIREKGTTVLFVSHDIGSVKSLCQYGVYLKNGVVQKVGKASDVAELYIKEMRDQLNEAQRKYVRQPQEFALKDKDSSVLSSIDAAKAEFKFSENFTHRVNQFRYGTGEARITYVEILDEDGDPIIDAEFNQMVKIRVYIESFSDVSISVNIHIEDDKKIKLTGANFFTSGNGLVHLIKNELMIVDYELRLPLQEGVYSLQVLISTPVILDQSAKFIDVIPDSCVFKVGPRPNAKVWSKVFLNPKLTIKKVVTC